MNRKLLGIYLNDHLAGSTTGIELVRRTCNANQGTELGRYLAELTMEIESDRRTLQRIMDDLGIRRDPAKVAGAWLLEKAGRLKLNGHLTGYSPQSRVVEIEGLVVGVTGKRCLWAALHHIAPQEVRLDIDQLDLLIGRADSQLERLEELRLKAISEAVAAAQRT